MKTLKNLIRFHKRKWATKSFSIFGGIWFMLEVFNFVDDQILDKLYSVLAVLLLSILIGLILTYKQISNTIIPISSGASIDISFGDLLNSQTDYIVVPSSDFFDYHIGTDTKVPVNINSVLGQLLSRLTSKQYNFETEIQMELKSLTSIESDKIREENGLPFNKFEIGNTIFLKTRDAISYDVALVASCNTRFTGAGDSKSETTLPDVVHSISSCLNVIPQDKSISIPLVGTGFGRLGLNEKQLLEVLLSCVIEHSQRTKSKSKVNIVLHKSLRGEFPLYNLKKEWKS